MHEVSLMVAASVVDAEMFRTPLAIVAHFSAFGEKGLMASFLDREADSASEGFESMFALRVADYRDTVCVKAKAAIDLLWPMWSCQFDGEIKELIVKEMKSTAAAGGFL